LRFISSFFVVNFESKAVRFVGTWENPEWVAPDVCNVLKIQHARDAVSDFDEDERGVDSSYTPSGLQNGVTLKKSRLYSLNISG
jgi:prophage antirepressor-like protein